MKRHFFQLPCYSMSQHNSFSEPPRPKFHLQTVSFFHLFYLFEYIFYSCISLIVSFSSNLVLLYIGNLQSRDWFIGASNQPSKTTSFFHQDCISSVCIFSFVPVNSHPYIFFWFSLFLNICSFFRHNRQT